VFAAPYHLDPVAGPQPGQPGYGRPDNPTRAALEAAIGELEGGECVVFASGMAAIAAVLQAAALGPGFVVMPSDGYYAAPRARRATAPRRAVRADRRTVSVLRRRVARPPGEPGQPRPGDVRPAALGAAATAAGALVAVDNTTATPLGQRPLDLGADISVGSGTKALSGHSDVVLGYACARSPDPGRRAALVAESGRVGARAVRGVAGAQVDRDARPAAGPAVGERGGGGRPAGRAPAVLEVRWPGRPDDPAFELARRQLRRVPGVVTFTLADKAAVGPVPAGLVARARGDVVRRPAHHGGPARAVGRRGSGGTGAALLRRRGHDDLVADITTALKAV
jgi:cystathionine gamma-lyase